jgi:2-polyprenyl-3-methyl-5-hydroxy-6-metoxy-1,4-benzoquinol methylase
MKPCPVCASTENSKSCPDTRQDGNRFLFCSTCGHGYCSKPPFADTADQAEFNQNSFFGQEGQPFVTWADFTATHEPSARWHCRRFQEYASGDQLLEIGCGLGGFLKYAKEHSRFVCHANDISPKATKFVRDNLQIESTTGAFAKELFLPRKFDVVYLSHVIEHIPDPVAFVRDLGAVCNPNAIVAIVCPNDASLCSAIKRKILFPLGKTNEYGQMHWPMHINGFTPRSLHYLFTHHGYASVLETTWSRVQKESSYTKSFVRDTILYPVYVAEYLLNRGGLIVSYFRWQAT